jgi:hypothetical protein
MGAVAARADRGPVVSTTVAAGAIVVLVLAGATGLPLLPVSAAVAVGVLFALGQRTLLRWHVLLASMILVILFIPIKRYELGGNLPFDLEPYRLWVALIMAGWVTSLLVDPRVRARGSGLEGPLWLIALSALGSALTNGPRIDQLQVGADVTKGLTFLLSFLLVFYLLVSVVRTLAHVRLLVKVLVAGGAVVACFALFEAQTGFNIFNQLSRAMPFLNLKEDLSGPKLQRGGNIRVFASAQGPIPLGAALVMLVPLALYLARASSMRVVWLGASLILTLGALASGSRTPVVMLTVVGLVFLWLRPRDTRRALLVMLVPAILAAHIVLPGAIGTIRGSFFPEEGLIAQQSENANTRGSGRIADLGPAMDEFVVSPLLGQGYGTRITGRERANAQILDNQWLKTLLETGALGAFAWLWLFVRFARRLAPAAKADQGERGWLITGLVASVTAFAVGSLLYDAFAFIQVTFLLYILLALGAVLVTAPQREARLAARARAAAPSRRVRLTPAES